MRNFTLSNGRKYSSIISDKTSEYFHIHVFEFLNEVLFDKSKIKSIFICFMRCIRLTGVECHVYLWFYLLWLFGGKSWWVCFRNTNISIVAIHAKGILRTVVLYENVGISRILYTCLLIFLFRHRFLRINYIWCDPWDKILRNAMIFSCKSFNWISKFNFNGHRSSFWRISRPK